ncbi:sugar porter family MFS transporter [Candidatus Mycobacterium wuenschmannii]|uniref:Sugar porter family MFS transporter n=1 Tax=Candidatus Mycobacterium wuenschmannii TaxID=3027808 RepID=A0ABY8VXK5_9MYCO|nr:sugar porter family MFS transporter [Candidatus Mycobacterium wuenschmannii]WIM87745.1 sugar porter family MFS transporter [Candidatus Mycobacterium wuenschmannii]
MSRIGESLRTRRRLLIAVTAAALGIICGYDLSNIAGALLFITNDFSLTVRKQELLTTMVVIGEICGALSGGFLANAIGRKKSMMLVAGGYAVFSLLGAAAVSMPWLMTARMLLGMTIGLSATVTPVYIAESAPARLRGSLLVTYQVATILGIIGGYLSAFALADSGSWRWMLGLAAVPALLVLPLLATMPDTARWYLFKNRVDDARTALLRVEPNRDVETELAEIADAMREERGGSLLEMLRLPYLRATAFVVGLGFFAELSGINGIIYYSPLLFQAMGFEGNFSLLVLPALIQLASLGAVLTSLVLVDRVGRRPILLSGISAMILGDLVLVGVFAARSEATSGLGYAGLLLFTMGFTFGFGALVWVYAGESFPAHLRSLGSSAMLTANLTANALIEAVFLTMLNSLGGAGMFMVFAGLATVGLFLVYRFAPETKGRQLEDIRRFWENNGHWPDETADAATDVPACR